MMYTQDPQSFEISYQQAEYVRHLRPISMTKERRQERESAATDREVNALRAVNGAANWLSGRTRPDLWVQTSFSQQCFSQPKVKDLLYANQLVHRARQHSDMHITVKDIPLSRPSASLFTRMLASPMPPPIRPKQDISWRLLIRLWIVMKNLDGQPFCWRSYKMPRVGEAQAFASASGVAEWVSLMLVEAQQGSLDLRESQKLLGKVPLFGITDCKSLYDAVHSVSSPSKVEDKRVAIDLAIIRQAVERTGMKVRWCPTELMLADSRTKDSADPADLLRAALQCSEHQLAPEASVLAQKKQQREACTKRQQAHAGHLSSP